MDLGGNQKISGTNDLPTKCGTYIYAQLTCSVTLKNIYMHVGFENS